MQRKNDIIMKNRVSQLRSLIEQNFGKQSFKLFVKFTGRKQKNELIMRDDIIRKLKKMRGDWTYREIGKAIGMSFYLVNLICNPNLKNSKTNLKK